MAPEELNATLKRINLVLKRHVEVSGRFDFEIAFIVFNEQQKLLDGWPVDSCCVAAHSAAPSGP